MEKENELIDQILKNSARGEEEFDAADRAKALYDEGKLEEAAKLWFKAAEAGDSYAQTCLGICYLEGDGVPEDEAAAVEWFKKAVAQDYPQAYYEFDMCLLTGTGIEENAEEAVNYLKKAAEYDL
ncbi:MAG: sel1 repeat family protein, partial [Clostridia bacterium]|nr:sel1 repeat family protein [Clostridia bacterium]